MKRKDTTCYVLDMEHTQIVERCANWREADELSLRHTILTGRAHRAVVRFEAEKLGLSAQMGAIESIESIEQEAN